MAFELPPLPYAFDALEPHIDAKTMEIHHDRHHGTYVTNLNGAIEKHPELAGKSVDELLRDINSVPDDVRTVVRNHGGGHANHSLFWVTMKAGGGGEPSGTLADALKSTFGDFSSFKDTLSKAAIGQFGSGWGWLVKDGSGKLQVVAKPNQDSPLMEGLTPLLAWWNTINWDEVAKRFSA